MPQIPIASSLHPPPPFTGLQPAAPASAPVCPEEEAALDAELEALRAQAMQGRAECLALRQQLRGLDADLAAAGEKSLPTSLYWCWSNWVAWVVHTRVV